MSCPVCGRVVCDHTPAERGQSHGQMMSDYYSDPGVQEVLQRAQAEEDKKAAREEAAKSTSQEDKGT